MDPPAIGQDVHTVVLVEGASDRAAIESLAARRGRLLREEGVAVIEMKGVTNVGHFLRRFGPTGRDLRVCGLCDSAEEPHVRRALAQYELGVGLDDFFVCDADLEDELIRALGNDAMYDFIERQGELDAFVTFAKQPAQQGRPVEAQLRRFVGTRSGRKLRYAPALIDAIETDRIPRPLEQLLAML